MFNPLMYTQELEKAGFTRQQAEATVNMLHPFREETSDIKSEIKELKHAIIMLEHRMTIKLGSMLIIAIGVLVALQKLGTL